MTKEEFWIKWRNPQFADHNLMRSDLDSVIQQAIAEHEAWKWKKYPENKPEVGIEVLGQSTAWIDEDYNPKGTRVCFWDDLAGWISAKWNNTMDCYDTFDDESPEKWRTIQ